LNTRNIRWRLLALIGVFALVVAACGDDDSGGTTQAPTTAGATTTAPPDTAPETTEAPTTTAAPEPFTVRGAIAEPPSIDPQLVSDSEGFEVDRLLFDGLTLYDPEGGAVVPGAAETWEANEDNTVWTFHIQQDLAFADGSPVTADAFVRGFNRLADPDTASPVAYHGGPILGWNDVNGGEGTGEIGDEPVDGVVAVDDYTLQITTTEPFVFLAKVVAHPAFSPIPETLGDGWADMPVGNGPYMMAEPWQHEVSISLVRNPHYAGPRPQNPDGIDFSIFADRITAEFQAFVDGQLDVHSVAPENEDQATSLGYELNELPTGSFGYLGYPTQTPPFDDPQMRMALTMAVDREAIATRILKRQVANGFVPPVAFGAVDGLETCPGCVFDPEAAKALYDELGGIPGNTVDIAYNAGAGHDDWIEAVANDWENNLGLTVTFSTLEWAAYLEFLGITGGPPPVAPYRLGWLWDYPSAYNFLAPLYYTGSGDNFAQYSNPDFDAAIDAAAAAASEDEAIPFLVTAQEIIGQEMPVMPITYGTTRWTQNDTVANAAFNNFGFFLWEYMTAP